MFSVTTYLLYMNDDLKLFNRVFVLFIALFATTAGIIWFITRAEKVVNTGIIRYEEFQEIYNSCEKINTDLCNMREMPEGDPSFQQFSKAQRINSLKTSLNRWVQEYNSKSKQWTHSMWKSNNLPYQLSVSEFKCY